MDRLEQTQSAGLMQYTEEPVRPYDQTGDPLYGRRKRVQKKKKLPVAALIAGIAALALLLAVVLYAVGVIPDFLHLRGTQEAGENDTSSQDGSTGATDQTTPAAPVTLSLSSQLLVFRVTEGDTTDTIMEYSFDTINAPDGPGPLSQALASESAAISEAVHEDPVSQGQISYDDYHNVAGFDVYQQESKISVERADHVLCSFVETTRINPGYYEFEYTGYRGFNVNVSTGEMITLADVVRDRDALYTVLLELLAQDEGRANLLNLYEAVSDDLRGLVEEGLCFTLTEEGLHVWFGQTDLGQGLVSACDVLIPFADYPDLFLQNDYTSASPEEAPAVIRHTGITEVIYELSDYMQEHEVALKRNFFREISGVWRSGGVPGTPYIRIQESGYMDYFDAEGVLLYDGYLEATADGIEYRYDFQAYVYDEHGNVDHVEPHGTVYVVNTQELYFTVDGNRMYMVLDTSTE